MSRSNLPHGSTRPGPGARAVVAAPPPAGDWANRASWRVHLRVRVTGARLDHSTGAPTGHGALHGQPHVGSAVSGQLGEGEGGAADLGAPGHGGVEDP